MIMNMKTKQGYILHRVHCKLGEIITWNVLNKDDNIIIGVIRRVNDHWMMKRFGWRQMPEKFWIGSIYITNSHIVGNTRESLLNQLLDIRKP